MSAILTEGLTFDAERHAYTLDGMTLPSVTTVLGKVYPELWQYCGDFAKERGTIVHETIDLWLSGDLDEGFLSPSIEGYLAAAKATLSELGFAVEAHELRMASRTMGVTGTADLIGKIKRKGRSVLAVLDWGTGDKGWAGGLQTAAYAAMFQENTGHTPTARFAVYLKADGQYHVHEYTSREDLPEFLAALRVYRRKAL